MFNEVDATNGVCWDFVNKVVVTDEAIWQDIFKRNSYAGAYYYRDKPEFNLLGTVFGLFDVNVEDSAEVITLSDNTEIVVLSDSAEPNQSVRRTATAMSIDLMKLTHHRRAQPRVFVVSSFR
ncbi:uncharacterized protein LOC125201110 isoform X2 [Salvia hispanica]|nr:uncharacterized protein LOC125201110 isoform X2 [Salvia hispanica]